VFNIKLMNPKFYTKMNSSLKKFKTNILSVVIFIIGISAHSQNILISQGGTVNVSGGEVFYDAGGAAGNDGNTTYTITLAPAIAGQAVCVDFTSFISNGSLEIFDGPNTAATNIGTLRGDYSLNYNAAGTPYRTGQTGTPGVPDVLSPGIFCANNASGVLTFRYTGPSGYAGWIGQVITYKQATAGCTVGITATPSTICVGGSSLLNATGVLGVPLMSNNFNTSSVGAGWVSTASVSFQNVLACEPNNGFPTANNDNSIFVWMQSAAAPRTLETTSYDVSGGGYLSFDFREAADDNGGNGCEAPDDNEGIYIQYSTDNGVTWNNLKLMFPGPESSAGASANIGCGMYVYDWNTTTIPLPSAALTANTKFRWTQRQSTSNSQDSWGLDNVRITRYSTATLTITDLSTSTVIATTTTPSTSISVSPATTRTYRATLTDGTTTCTQDVTVTVNGGTPTVIGYPTNVSSFASTAAATNVTVISGPTPTANSYISSPPGLTMNSAGRITPSTSTPGTYTVTANTACGTTSATVVILPPQCGNCATPNCPIAGPYPTYTLANTNNISNCNVLASNLNGPTTYVSYYTVTSSSIGSIGAIISNQNGGIASCNASKVAVLYTPSNCATSTIPIAAVLGSNGSSYYNPEWTGLTPNTTYTMVVTTTVLGSCWIEDQCVSYYQPTVVGCTTCATATCPVSSITTVTAALGQTGITTTLNTAGDTLGLTPMDTPGQSITVCVPVTVPIGSTILGFKNNIRTLAGCATPTNLNITYELKLASNCSGVAIAPNRANASSVGSGFNPEWDGLTPGNYVLCYTITIKPAFDPFSCVDLDLNSLGYYNVIPPPAPCQDYQIQLYDDDLTSSVHTGTTFACTDPGVYLGPATDPTVFDSGLPFQSYKITVVATTGNLNNLVLNRYDAATNLLAEQLTLPASGISDNYFLRPSPGQYYKLDKTNLTSGTYTYTIIDAISGATVASGTWTITGGAESLQSVTLIPQGTSVYSGPGVTNGFDPTGVNNYTNDRGIGFFNPALAGAGTHTITYTWNNGLAAPNNCTLTRTRTVTVTGPSAPTVSNVAICSGQTATLTASGGTIYKWYDAATGGTLLFTGNPFVTPALSAPISYWVTNTVGSCESTRTQVNVTITPGVAPTYTLTPSNCAPGSITFSGVSAGATFDWISGPSGYTFPVGFQTPSTTNTSLTALPAGTYCVDITSPNVAGGTVTTTLLNEDFESNAPNWTIDNSGGNNIFVINNAYLGGTCTIGGVPFAVPNIPNQGAWATAGPQSKYLHIKATTTCGFACAEGAAFPPLNANFCSTVSDQKFTLNTPLNTVGKTNVTFNFYFICRSADVDDYGTLEYSINGGTTWIQAGANLSGATVWTNRVTTLPAWDNQPSLLFRLRWRNDASASSDPPLSVDQITITAQTTAVTSCGTTIQECITILPTPATPTITSVAASCSAAGSSTISNYSASNTYIFTPSGPTVGATGLISGMTVGTSHTVTATNGGCTSLASASFSNAAQLPTPATPTITFVAASCSSAGSSTISNYSASNTYAFTPSGPTVAATGLISGMTVGTSYTVTATNGGCTSLASASFSNAAQLTVQPIPTITSVAASCSSAGSSTISNYSASNTYAFTPSGPTVGATGLISGMTVGTSYTVTATNGGCTSLASASFSNAAQLPTPVTPTITSVVASCSAAGSSTISNYSASNTYTFTPAGPTVGATGLISGMTVGTSYTVTATNGGCTSLASASFSNAAQLPTPATPAITSVAASCSSAGSSTISNYSASNTYTFTPAGPTVGATGLISGMTVGTSYTVTATNGGCTSVASASFSNAAQLPTPVTPTITSVAASCSSAGSSTISNYSASITYTFTPAGPTVGATGLISGMIVGTSYTVTATNGGCTSVASASFSNAAQLPTPATPTITSVVASCSAAGSSTISNYSASNTYTFTPAGPTVGATGLISGMTVGTSYTVTATNGGCTSLASASFSNAAQLPTPATPTITSVAASCSSAGSSTISNYSASNTYAFTPSGPTVAATGLISGMTVGTSYTVTATNGGCTSLASASFSNAAQLTVQPIPTITSVAASCSSAGSSTISNYSASNTYAFTPSGPTVGATGLISGMTVGTSYTVTATNGGCTSLASASFSNAAQLPTPATPTITSVAASCSSAGSSTISNYSASNTYAFTPSGPTVGATGLISGMTVGTSYTVTATNGGCTSLASASFSNAAQLPTPATPTITSVAASCSSAGSSTISNYSASNTYAFTPSGPTVGATGLISGMTVGTSYTVTATNGGCTSLASASFSNAAQLPTPATPTITSVAASCSSAGSSTISNYSASNTYAFTPSGPTVGATGLISGMTVGTSYTVTATNGGCTSLASASFSNAAQLPTPATPTITSVAASCSSAGSSTISNYSASNTYVFTPSGPTVGATGLISGMTVGTSYTVTATNGGCTSLASASFSNAAQLPTPATPTITSVAASCSAAGSSTISNYSASNTYIFTPSGPTVGATGLISGMTVGTSYTVTATNGGCTSLASASFSNAAQLPTPATPTITSVAASCSSAGSSTISNYSASNTYAFTPSGPTVGATGLISGMTVGTSYTVTATNGGCTSLASAPFDNQDLGIPTIINISFSSNICDGSSTDIVLTSNVPGTTYTWSATVSNIAGTYVTNGDGSTINQIATLTDSENIGTISMVIIPRANGCDGTPITILITVNSIPVVESVSVADTSVCSATSTANNVHVDIVGNISGITYTWTAITSGVSVVGGGTSGTITATSTTAVIDLRVITSNPLVAGTIYFIVTPVRNGCVGTPMTSGIVTVNPNPGLPIPSPIKTICSGNSTDLIVDVSPLITGTQLTWEVLTVVNVTGATPGTGVAPVTINDVLTATTNTQGYVIYRVRSTLGDCKGVYTDYRVNVNPSPRPVLTDGNICITATGEVYQTYTLNSGLNDVDYDFEWFDSNGDIIPGATNSTLVVDAAGTYSVIATNWLTGCSSDPLLASATATVTATTPATVMTVVQSEYFSDNATITVNVTGGSGTLLYSIDEGSFQSSNVFTGVSAGEHLVTVIDTEGCTYMTQEVLIIDYPRYFTPNGDGINDTWNIIGLNQADAKLYIFDRYGKLLKQLSATQGSEGWDGTYNQAELPSTDYWFTLDYTENGVAKQFKAHFSLIR
jgi:gliding motility-associated-like protein